MAEVFKRIDEADFAVLSQWEPQFTRIVYAKYLQGVGSAALDWMQEWWRRYAEKTAPKVNKNCADCIASFLRDVGRAYFAEKELRAVIPADTKVSVASKPKHAQGATGEQRKNARKVTGKTKAE